MLLKNTKRKKKKKRIGIWLTMSSSLVAAGQPAPSEAQIVEAAANAHDLFSVDLACLARIVGVSEARLIFELTGDEALAPQLDDDVTASGADPCSSDDGGGAVTTALVTAARRQGEAEPKELLEVS